MVLFDQVVGAACLLLSGKVEETPKKCKDILRTVHGLMQDKDFSAYFGNDPKVRVKIRTSLMTNVYRA